MAQFVKIAAVQFESSVEDSASNRFTPAHKELILKETADTLSGLEGLGLDLVVLSEGIGALGQSLEDAEDPVRGGPFLDLYSDFAASQKCHVAGPAKTARDGRIYNSVVLFGPSGSVLGTYDKVNLTTGEIGEGLASGRQAVVVDTAIGRIGGVICFDLNFESLRSQYVRLRPDILVFPSMFHGGIMQAIWAYECRAYFVCSWQNTGCGILDPFGRPVALTHCYDKTAIATVNLDRVMVHLDFNSEKFSRIRRKYRDEAVIDTPADVGRALITSASDKRSAPDIAREFGLELLDDYLARSAEANDSNRS